MESQDELLTTGDAAALLGCPGTVAHPFSVRGLVAGHPCIANISPTF
jgi:hypothetical protein